MLTILSIFGYILLYLVMLAGIVVIPLGIPGEFAILAAVIVLMLFTGTSQVSWLTLVILVCLCLLAELIEAVTGFAGAKYKGSLWSAFGALVGGLIGTVIGAAFGLIIGALIGALVGTFAGAFLIEYHITRHSGGAACVATHALIGRMIGSAVKVAIATVMLVLVTLALIF